MTQIHGLAPFTRRTRVLFRFGPQAPPRPLASKKVRPLYVRNVLFVLTVTLSTVNAPAMASPRPPPPDDAIPQIHPVFAVFLPQPSQFMLTPRLESVPTPQTRSLETLTGGRLRVSA
jgi:hypothetical protein